MNEIQIFNYQNKQIRTVEKDGEPWWVLKDVCEVLEISHIKNTADRLEKDEVGQTEVIDSLGRKQMTTIINESGLYNVILRSDKPQAKPFRKWVTSEVLPSIRKHGMYAVDQLLDNPDLAIAAFTALKEARKKNAQLEETISDQRKEIEEMKPKASYYDLVLQSKNSVPITLIAKDYGISAVKMNQILHDLKIQYKSHNCWVLRQPYADKGYVNSITYSVDESYTSMRTQWTQKGRLFIYNTLKEKLNLIPVMEREIA